MRYEQVGDVWLVKPSHSDYLAPFILVIAERKEQVLRMWSCDDEPPVATWAPPGFLGENYVYEANVKRKVSKRHDPSGGVRP